MGFTNQDYVAFGIQFLRDVIEYITEYYDPEDIFDPDILAHWAEQNDYVKKEESEE